MTDFFPSDTDPIARLHRTASVIAFVVMLGFGGIAAIFLALGIVENWLTLAAALVPAAFFGIQARARRARPFAGLVFAAVVITWIYRGIGAVETLMPTVTAVLLMLVLGALFVDYQRRALFLVGGTIAIAVVPWLWQDGVPVNLPTAAVGLAALFLMGAGILLWFRGTLEHSAERYSALFEAAPTGMMEQDWSGVSRLLGGYSTEAAQREALANDDFLIEVAGSIRILRSNQAMAEIAELAAVSDLTAIRVEGLTEAAREGLVEQCVGYMRRRPVRVEFETRSTRNRQQWVEVRLTPLSDSDPGRVLVLVDDITAAKTNEAALEAEVANKDQFIASVSHELRTPLTVVLGMLEELGSGTVDESMVTELVGMAASQAREMSYIVEDLLVEARAGIGGVSVQLGPVDVRATAAAVVRESETVMAVSGMEEGGVFASGDPVRVRQILRNLVVNAHRYGGAERRIVLADAGDAVTFEVRDSGGPLPDSIAQRIFEPYQRAHHGEGSPASIGLGLAVSRQLAAMMGGDVRYQHDGESVFSLILPKWEAVVPHADESEHSIVSGGSE